MKYRPLSAVPALLLFAVLSACGSSGGMQTAPSIAPTPSVSAQTVSSLAPEPTGTPPQLPLLDTDIYEKIFTAEDGSTLLTVFYSFPHLINAEDHPSWQAVNDFYDTVKEELADSAETRARQQADDYARSAQHGWDYTPVREEARSAATYLTPHCISVARTFYVFYEGAAHPFVSLYSEQLDLTTGTRLRFADCFTGPQRAAEQALAAILASPEGAALQDSGVSAGILTDALQPEHFYLTGEGFVFWYQSGDLGTNNSPVEIPISYQIFDGLLQPWVA